MQANLRFFLYTVFGVLAIWYMLMVIDIHVFMHTDVDDIVSGTMPLNRTDIGERCGAEYANSPSLVDYKLTSEGVLKYLCPPGISPIRSKVTAEVVTDAFRRTLSAAQQAKIMQFYPVAAPAAAAPAAQGTIPVTATPETAATAPAPAAPAPAPAMSSTPPPVENTSPVTPAPAAPANNDN
jgi:hypothetical protein